jgi:hypothetical protein
MRRLRDYVGGMACFTATAWAVGKMLLADTTLYVGLYGFAALFWLLWGLFMLITYIAGE